MIDKERATGRIYGTYKRYGVTREKVEHIMNVGTEQGFSVLETYNLLRMTLGTKYREREYFSLTEFSEMLGQVPEAVIQVMGQQAGKAEIMDEIRRL